MTEGARKRRRVRVRRKRDRGSALDDVDEDVVEAVGCCMVELIAGATLLIGLLVLPTWTWLR